MDVVMRCGAGKADITPPIGTPMGGYANRLSPCRGMLDPLSARALLLMQAGHVCLLITLDALAIDAPRAQALCAAAARASGGLIAPGDARVICSHTHSGADLSGMFGAADHLSAYVERVIAAVGMAARQAVDSLGPATLAHGSTRFPIGRNRRLRPGHARVTDLERAQGAEIDHTLTVLRFGNVATGRPIAVLFHTACHPVCLGPENVMASGDWAGIAAQRVEHHTGALALFLNGACGNVTPVIGKGSSYEATCTLAQSVADALNEVPLLPDAGILGTAAETLAQLPLSCHFTHEEDIHRHATWLLQQDTGFHGWEATVNGWQRKMLNQLGAGTLPQTINIPLSATRSGETTLVFVAAEVFNEYQLWQPANVRLVTYTNGEGCYIPTAAALAGGGYEVSTAPVFYGLPCAPGAEAERRLIEAIREISTRL